MAQKPTIQPFGNTLKEKKSTPNAFSRVIKYALARGASIIIALIIGVYIAVVVTNFGGFIDDIYRSQIAFILMGKAFTLQDVEPPLSKEEKHAIMDQFEAELEEFFGLNEPFFNRTIKWTGDALVFNWGDQRRVEALWGPEHLKHDTRMVVLSRLPNSLLQ